VHAAVVAGTAAYLAVTDLPEVRHAMFTPLSVGALPFARLSDAITRRGMALHQRGARSLSLALGSPVGGPVRVESSWHHSMEAVPHEPRMTIRL